MKKAFNYAVITVTPEAQVTLRGDSKNIRHLGCNRFQILLGAAVYLAILMVVLTLMLLS